jgi:hypothetical protein
MSSITSKRRQQPPPVGLSLPIGSSDTRNNGSQSYTNYDHHELTLGQYFARIVDVSQMDIQSALDQMKSLLIPGQMHKPFKMAYYRKQTKNHWARDDPAFAALLICFLAISSLVYTIALRFDAFFSTFFTFFFHSLIINFLLAGAIVATLTRTVANQHLVATTSSSHVRQSVEWMYAFDVHCNAFFSFFILLYCVQFFLIPIVLGEGFVSFLVSNLLYTCGFSCYIYITHLGYRALPFLSNTEVFLFPIAVVVFIFILNLIGWPLNIGYNASRLMMYFYFD